MVAMMFALLQEQHRAQLNAMASANQKAMDAMFERMNAIVVGNGPGPDKENLPPGGNINPGPGNDTGTTKRKKTKCPHCGKTVFYKAAEHDSRACTSRLPPQEHGRAGDPNIQKSICRNPKRSR